MQYSTKDKTDRPNTARSTKTNPASSNICPSKLSRRELEDLYFTLTQSNLDLKRVINTQSEKIKALATKLQRMTNTQKIYLGSETKECCGATKALVQNQKNIIQDLKQSNEVLREQVKQLNMKLCSTKQFLKRPVTVMALTSLQRSRDMHGSAKHRSASALNSRSTTDDLRKEFTSVSCQCFISHRSTSALNLRSTAEKPMKDSTSVSCQCPESERPFVPCDENKCRTLMNELKREIASLQEALKTKQDDSDRVNRLDKEIVELRAENSHMKFLAAQQEQSMHKCLSDYKDVRQKLSEAENRCLDLETSLKIERSKVAELEAKIKANDICNRTYDKIAESQICKDVNKLRPDTPKAVNDYTRGKTQPKPVSKRSRRKKVNNIKLTTAEPLSRTEASTPQKLDDSGFADVNKSDDLNNQEKGVMAKNNQLLEKITDMQTQLNNLVKTLMSPNRQNYDFVPQDLAMKSNYVDKNSNLDQALNEPQKELPMTDDQRSLARTKYAAAKHFQEKEKSRRTMEQKHLYFDKTSTPVSSKSKIIRDSITKEPKLIPAQDPFFEDEQHTESLISKVTTPRSISKSHDSVDVEKRVSLKLEPEMYDNISNDNAETEKLRIIKHKINGDSQRQTRGSISSAEKEIRNSLNNQKINDDSEVHGELKDILKTESTPDEYTKEQSLQNKQDEKNSLLEKVVTDPGNKTDTELTGQTTDGAISNTGQSSKRHATRSWKTIDKSQSARDTSSLKNTLASMKEQLCSNETKTCGKKCLSKYQGRISEYCPCKSTDGKTGRCSCADVDLGPVGLPEYSTSHQKENLYGKAPRQKVLGPHALIDNSYANGKSSPKKSIGDPLSPEKANIGEFDAADSKEHLNEGETKSLNEGWPQGKIKDETLSLHSELSGTTNHIQRRLPTKPKALIIEPLAPVGTTDQQKSDQEKAVMGDKETFVDPLNICEEYVHICNCPKSTRREVAVFRSCSGTLRFRTVSNAEMTFKRCPCSNKNANPGTRDFEGTINANDVSPELNKTFTLIEATRVKPVAQISRSTSPENTDQEISHLTDLPSEKTTPVSTPRDRFRRKSPGEHIVTSTGTDTGTDYISSSAPISTTEPLSLSEGELPQSSTGVQEHKVPPKTPAEQTALPESLTKQVERSLQTIAEDMVRCRQLLYSTKALQVDAPKPIENKDNQESQLSSSNDSKISLHAVSGRSHLQQSPRVMFIMHIGTMVLSDEAVLSYRDLNLVLTWKFYDQNVSMSRVRPGRVVHFDFSTEYDQKLTDDFLNYLKTEELIINVCNVNNLETPLASCSLPLREALLHTNKRVDMSLALVADPSARRHPIADTIDKGDEVGVLDLWCMLRADVTELPQINKAITVKRPQTNSNSSLKRKSFSGPILDQIVLDDQDYMQEDELSSVAPVQKITPRDFSHDEFDSSVPITSQPEHLRCDVKKFPAHPLQRSASPTNFQTQHSTDFRPKDLQICDSATILGDTDTTPKQKEGLEEDRNKNDTLKSERHFSHNKPSGILINEVKPNIRNVADLKKALENRFIANKKVRRRSPPKPEVENTSLQDTDTSVYEKKVFLQREHRGVPRDSVTESKTEDSTRSIISDSPVVPSNSDRYFRKSESISQLLGLKRNPKPTKICEDLSNYLNPDDNSQKTERKPKDYIENLRTQTIDITILWLALNEECQAMQDPNVQRLYVAYSFLGHGGAELETPQSLPKPKQYHDKCYFNFKKRFHLIEPDIVALGHMAHVRSNSRRKPSRMDCVIFDVVSEPVEDPLGLNNCEDIGTAHLYFGDLIAYGAGSNTYTDVLPVRAVVPGDGICGVLAVRVDGLDLVRASARMMEAG